ncbi:DUF4397 domain-containing protein [Tumebacillus lipolyticus]|uniref:DUF4397 domain-containing protein n=1 Tax=Tumebacillus lipolyticus TaxID=1280370 RepID=A0ABW5A1Y5_9BACL
MNREERQFAPYEPLAREIEKLVDLVQQSQQNQYEFMQEACKLLQAQQEDVRSLLARPTTQEQMQEMLDKALEQMNAQFKGEIEQQIPQSGVITDAVPIPLDQPTGPNAPPAEFAPPEAIPVVKPVGQPTGARVRFFHASPNTPGVDVYIDRKKVAEDIRFQGISDYIRIAPGRHRVQVFPYGKQVGALIDSNLTAGQGQTYTLAIAGMQREIRPLVFQDEPSKTKPGFARLKIVHLSPNTPAVDITLPSGKVLISHLIYKEKSPYLQVTPGRRDLQLRLAGKKDVVLRLPKMRFDAGVTYTLYIVGLAKGEPKLSSELIPEV